MNSNIILIDQKDRMTGTMDKQMAHLNGGHLHRAVSVFIFNSLGELLIQQRAMGKYHSGGKWSNTACTHPSPGEQTDDAAQRCIKKEMGLSCNLNFVFSFTYKAEVEPGITEYEFDHVYFGISDDLPKPDPDEVSNFKYIRIDQLKTELEAQPDKFSRWLSLCFEQIIANLHKTEKI